MSENFNSNIIEYYKQDEEDELIAFNAPLVVEPWNDSRIIPKFDGKCKTADKLCPEYVWKIVEYEEKTLQDGGIVIWNSLQGSQSFRYFSDYKKLYDFIRQLKPEHRTYNEKVFASQKQKLRLDIDAKDAVFTQGYFTEITNAIRMAMSECFDIHERVNLIWCNSTDKEKTSWHVIVEGYYVPHYGMARKFGEKVQKYLIKQIRQCIDLQIYNSVSGLRLPYNYKVGSTRVKNLPTILNDRGTEAEIFGCALITNVENCVELKFSRVIMQELGIPTDKRPKDDKLEEHDVIRDILPLVDKKYWEGLSFRNYKAQCINFNRYAEGFCQICGELHHKDTAVYMYVRGRDIHVKCHHKPGVKELLKDIIPENIAKVEEVDDQPLEKTLTKDEIKKKRKTQLEFMCKMLAVKQKLTLKNLEDIIEYIGELNEFGDKMQEYPIDAEVMFVKAHMGIGKTQALERFIKLMCFPSILAASFRVSFTVDLARKLGLTKYSDYKGPLDCDTHPNLIVQMESFYRLKRIPYQLLILDEIESLIAQCFSSTNQQGDKSWKMFEYMIRNCAVVICMDANLSQETINLINDIRNDNPNVTVPTRLIINNALPQETSHYISTEKLSVMTKLNRLVTEGKNVVVPTSTRAMADIVASSMRNGFPNKKVKVYTSMTSDAEKQEDFADVNVAWSDINILVYTPTLMAGLSFTNIQFDAVVCFWDDLGTHVDNCMQMMRRVRNISSNEYYHYIRSNYKRLAASSEAVRDQFISRGVSYAEGHAEEMVHLMSDCTDYRMRACIQFRAVCNRSKNEFTKVMINGIKLINGKTIPMESTGANKEAREMIKNNKQMIVRSENAKIANARRLTAEEYHNLKSEAIKTPENKYELERYELRAQYSIPEGTAFSDIWVSVYKQPKLQAQFVNRQNVLVNQANKKQKKEIYAAGIRHKNTLEQHDAKDVDLRHEYCLGFLDMFGFEFWSDETITRKEFQDCIRDNFDTILKHSTIVRGLFTIQSTVKFPTKFEDTSKFYFTIQNHINGALKDFYGVDIKAVDTNKKMYKLRDNFGELFNQALETTQHTTK